MISCAYVASFMGAGLGAVNEKWIKDAKLRIEQIDLQIKNLDNLRRSNPMGINSIVTEVKGPPEEYPVIMQSKLNASIVFFTAFGVGMVVSSGRGHNPIGCFAENWVMGDFELFGGMVKLFNVLP